MTTYNYKNSNYFSISLFVPFLWFFVVTSRNISSWFKHDSSYVDPLVLLEEGSIVDRYFFLLLIFIGIIILLNRKTEVKDLVNKNKGLILFFLYLLLSILWSEYKYVSLKRWVKLLGALIMVLIIKTEKDDYESLFSIIRKVVFIHLPLSIIIIKYFRHYGVSWEKDGSNLMWTGVSLHKNTFGQLLMINNFYFIYEIFFKNKYNKNNFTLNHDVNIIKRYIYVIYLIMGLYLMNGPGNSRSVTSIIALVIGIMVLSITSNIKVQTGNVKNRLLKIAILALGIFIFVNIISLVIYENPTKDIATAMTGKDDTLSGRTELWKDIYAIASQNILFGVGYGAFWIGDIERKLWETQIWKPQQGHNGYLDTLAEVGMFGLAFLIMLIITFYRNIFNKQNTKYFSFSISVLTMIIIHNIAESSFLRATHSLWFLFLFIAIKK